MELSGYHFEAAGCDLASVLPMPTNLYNCIVAYEVLNEHSSNFNERVLHILLNLEEYKNKLSSLIDELKGNTTNVPGFHCMQDDNDDESVKQEELIFAKHSCDRQVWDDQPPERVGVYHAFVRPHTKDSIEHRIFIVLSGSLKFADEELFRLWQDTATYTSCEQILESEEVHWLKSATIRNHNRVAARVADVLGLAVRVFIDTEDPSGQRRSAHPCTISMKSDLELDTRTRRVHLVDGGAFLHKSLNGVLYELHGPEGYWIFCGPPDNASYNAFGTIWDYFGDMTCFPTSTFKFSDKFPKGWP